MPRGEKKPETYDKVAEHWKKVGDRNWAKAKNDEGGYHYEQARKAYERVERAKEGKEKRFPGGE